MNAHTQGGPRDDTAVGRTHTAESVAAIIRQNIESEGAEAVLAILKKINGPLITTRLLDKLPGGRIEWRLSRALGWTELKNRLYINSKGANREGICLILARTESSVPLSSDYVERENPAYFQGRRERNALRAKALADPDLLERLAKLFNKLEKVNKERAECRKEFQVFVAHGQPCAPDQYDLERACGLREDRDR